MNDWWNTLSGAHQAFWLIAWIFSLLFLIQLVLTFIGFDFERDDHAYHQSEFQTNHRKGIGLNIFSIRSFFAFFTFFGWGGIVAFFFGGSTKAAVIVGVITGLTAIIVVGYAMFWFSKLTQKQNTDLKKAIYRTGKVYSPIPGNGRGHGKVQISIGGSVKEINAITEGKNLPPGSTVRVIEVINDNVFVVEKVQGLLPHELFQPRK